MMNMRKKNERTALLTSLAAAGALCFAGTGAYAASITVGTATGAAGGTAPFSVTLQTGGASVLGTQNDVDYDPSTPVAVSLQGNCGVTTSKTCTTDADCPNITPPPLTGKEPCVNLHAPACTVNVTGKGGFFAFEPSNCKLDGTSPACTGIRALIFALNNVTTAIPDGTTLYTCNVNIKPGTANGDYPLTVPAASVQIADIHFQQVPNPTATNGKVTVGPVGSYTVCDVAPSSGDGVGAFGDGTVDIFDVRSIFAAAQLGVDVPADGTPRFSAMDSSTVDVPPACGGDQTLDIFDVRQCFNVGQLGATNFTRQGTGTICKSTAIPQ